MATIDLDLVEENDALTAASLNSRFTAIRTGVLDIPVDALEDHALGPNHLPSLVIDINATPDLSRYFVISPPYSATPPVYTTWGNSTDWAEVTDGTGGAASPTGPLEILFDLMTLGMGQTARVGAVLVFANLSLTLPATSDTFYFCLQYKTNAGAWTTIRSTETIISPGEYNVIAASQQTFDVPINTILRITEVPVAFKGLRVAHAATGGSYLVNKGELTIIPLHCAVS